MTRYSLLGEGGSVKRKHSGREADAFRGFPRDRSPR